MKPKTIKRVGASFFSETIDLLFQICITSFDYLESKEGMHLISPQLSQKSSIQAIFHPYHLASTIQPKHPLQLSEGPSVDTMQWWGRICFWNTRPACVFVCYSERTPKPWRLEPSRLAGRTYNERRQIFIPEFKRLQEKMQMMRGKVDTQNS